MCVFFLFSACPYYQLPCPNGKKCVYRSQLCDGRSDCPSGFDEEFCATGEKHIPLNPEKETFKI